jgi:ankyrin repeat protein
LGDTALHAAAWKGYADIVQLLLEKGKVCVEFIWLLLALKNRPYQIIPFEIVGKTIVSLFYYFYLLIFAVLGIEPRALCVLGEHSTMELHPQPLVSLF